MRLHRSRWWMSGLLVMSTGCHAAPAVLLTMPAVASTTPSASMQLALALPAGAERCVITSPGMLVPGQRPLAALLSQSDTHALRELLWTETSQVQTYARAEQTSASGARAVVELLRFAGASREQIVAALRQAPERNIVWDSTSREPRDACAGELTCTPWHARFEDDQTVRLTHGEWNASDTSESACVSSLRELPTAIEVSARSALLGGTELRDSRARLERDNTGLTRITDKRYAEAGAAERALREARRGHDELPAIAGVVASSFGERHGAVLTETVHASFADLQLAHDDQQRARLASAQERVLPVLSRIDAHDAEAVRLAVDDYLPLARSLGDEQLRELVTLLERARELSPDDEGLASRLYTLQQSYRHDAQAALATAERALTRFEPTAWLVRRRAALAWLDEARLRTQLQREHSLSREAATQMARELSQQVRAGGDYERAEWVFLTAKQLARPSLPRRAGSKLDVPVLELVRWLAYLKQAERPHEELAVRVLLMGAAAAPTRELLDEPTVVIAETRGAGRAGWLLATSSAEDGQLRTLGRALASALEEGPFELLLGLEALGGTRRHILAITGQRSGATLRVEQVSEPLTSLRSRTVERVLLAPLRGLIGATFPPDEVVVEALDAAEQSRLTRAAESVPNVICSSEQLTVRCHGPLSDRTAAQRTLLAICHDSLADTGGRCGVRAAPAARPCSWGD